MDNNISFAKQLEPKLRPLYSKLIKDVSHIKVLKDTFAVQWGKFFPKEKNEGILCVGRATNEWYTTEENIDVLFGNSEMSSTIFNCDDQMTWVYDCWDKGTYQTRRSAFWRVIRAVANSFYGIDELNHIAWSNVCKIQKHSGKNPQGEMFDCQIKTCQEIFKTEIEILSPKFIIMFTGNYGRKEILSYMNGGNMPQPIDIDYWGRYKAIVYKIGNEYYICTEHPMGKEEHSHIECLKKQINKYKQS